MKKVNTEQGKREFSYVFIHGFESTGKGYKYQLFRKAFINNKSEKSNPPGGCYLVSPTLWEAEEEFENTSFARMFTKITAAVRDAAEHGEKVILLGSSFGGLLVTRFMQTKQPGHELVSGCAIVSPVLHFSDVLTDSQTGSKFLLRMLVDKKNLGKLPHADLMAEWERTGAIKIEYLKMELGWKPVDFKWKSFADFREQVSCVDGAGLGVPTFVLHSLGDDVIPYRYTEGWLGSLPEKDRAMISYHLIKKGSHGLGDVPELTDMIIDWVRKTF